MLGVYCDIKEDVNFNREQGIQGHREEKSPRRKGKIHIHVQLGHLICQSEGQCDDSKAPGSIGFVVRMTNVLDRLPGLLPASDVHAREWKALPTSLRGLSGAVQSYRLLAIEGTPNCVLYDHHDVRRTYTVRLWRLTAAAFVPYWRR